MTEDALSFQIDFKGPYLVSTGRAAGGIDATPDRDVPLPATALKGVIRAEACQRLQIPPALTDAVFGTGAIEAAWAWTDPPASGAPTRAVTRTRLDGSGRPVDGFVAFLHVVWSGPATFAVVPRRHLDPETLRRHRLVLRAAARSVTALGSGRRRGLGWVSIRDLDQAGSPRAWTAEDTSQLLDLVTT